MIFGFSTSLGASDKFSLGGSGAGASSFFAFAFFGLASATAAGLASVAAAGFASVVSAEVASTGAGAGVSAFVCSAAPSSAFGAFAFVLFSSESAMVKKWL